MVRTRSNGTSVGVADVDSTSQVQVLTTSYPAEYGRTSGGQIRMVPKSGSNSYHGSAFEYFRNSALKANTWQRNFNGQPRAAGGCTKSSSTATGCSCACSVAASA